MDKNNKSLGLFPFFFIGMLIGSIFLAVLQPDELSTEVIGFIVVCVVMFLTVVDYYKKNGTMKGFFDDLIVQVIFILSMLVFTMSLLLFVIKHLYL